MRLRVVTLILCAFAALGFTYEQAGNLIPGSGNGQPNSPIQIVDMRFPMESAPAYPNSQVYRPGGLYGGGGSQCDASNYDYPWRDNYCEIRTGYSMPLCPDGTGHQGQDIRPATCQDNTHWVVATENGRISNIGSYSVYLQGDSGVRHRFLHMDMANLAVSVGSRVTRGQRLGRASNDFGGTPTTIHLHYDMYKFVSGLGNVYVSPYNTLVDSYEALLGFTGIENPGAGCTPTPVTGAENNRFEDVVSGSTGEAHIYALADAGITNGCAPDLFCPDCNVERYQMAVFIARAASLDVSNPPATPSFGDVSPSDWYFPHVEAVKAAGIVNGCGDGTNFCPRNTLTRAEAAKFVVLGAGLPLVNPATPSCSDVPTSAWSYRYVETAAEYCITTNCNSGGAYNPDGVVSRRIAAIFIARAFDLNNLNTCVQYCDPDNCDDASSCSAYEQCGGFSDACDESGREYRTCTNFACTGSYTNGTCSSSSSSESRTCYRDTDGEVVSGFTAWSACDVTTVNADCSGSGTQQRSRQVCEGGVSTEDLREQSCEVASVGSSFESTWYRDADGDGFGDATDAGTIYCADPGDGSVENNSDCDDSAGGGGAVFPGADEVCDGIDNDCDGAIDLLDDSLVGLATFYEDADGDGHGNPGVTVESCETPAGYVALADDCDDTEAAIFPGAEEACDELDNDCDGLVDDLDPDVVGQDTWYADTDGDGFGDANAALDSCGEPSDHVADATDCDDTRATVYPDAEEVCDQRDNNCDGTVDEGCDNGGSDGGTGSEEPGTGGCACSGVPAAPQGSFALGSLALLMVGRRRRDC